MNKHVVLDKLTATIASWLTGRKKFFSESIESRPIQELIKKTWIELPDFNACGTFVPMVNTGGIAVDPAFKVVQWLGQEFPTILFNHGNNEKAFDFRKTAKNTFYQVFLNWNGTIEANLIQIRAPFHNSTLTDYQEKMTDLENFTAMLAATVSLNEGIIQKLTQEGHKKIILSGISLGGWVTNLHRTFFNSASLYLPLLAGAHLAEVFLSSAYRKLTAKIALEQPKSVRELLNFDQLFSEIDSKNLYPLLARYDQYIEYNIQKTDYEDHPLNTIECGHVTAALSPQLLRHHILNHL
jgi:hypothetical protein